MDDLPPGHAQHYWIKLRPDASRLTIDVTNVDLGVDPLLANSFEVYVTSAIRSTNISYVDTTNVYGDAQIVIEDLNTSVSGDVFGVATLDLPIMPGYVRLVIENDWTTYDNISGTFTVTLEQNADRSRDEFYSDSVNTGESDGFFPVGFGANGVELELSWRRDWTRYSTSDLEMIVVWTDTDGNSHVDVSGATFGSPEKVVISASNIAEVQVLVDGYQTYGKNEPWKLKVNYID